MGGDGGTYYDGHQLSAVNRPVADALESLARSYDKKSTTIQNPLTPLLTASRQAKLEIRWASQEYISYILGSNLVHKRCCAIVELS